jgi:hypothetical protein
VVNRIFPIDHPDSSDHTSHQITSREGAELIRAHRDHPEKHALRMFNHVSFHGEAFNRLLSLPDAVGIRCSMALRNGAPTLVLHAIDASGCIVGPNAEDNGQPCPPFCD